ncbi:MAG: sigma factor-like helix-turn-helix DNA-binding protein [Candidatus Moraniibacteriota bacterium]
MKITRKNLDKLTWDVLSQARERGQKVFILRFGLNGKQPWSLAKIGKSMNITRERVRQIESENFNKIKKSQKGEDFDKFEQKALAIIQKRQGICEKMLLKTSLVDNPSEKEINQLIFLLNCSKKINYKKETVHLQGYWTINNEINPQKISAFSELLTKIIKKQKKPLLFNEIKNIIQKEEIDSFFKKNGILETCLILNKNLKRNILGEWGLKSWSTVSERGNKEKAYLVLKKQQKTLYYKDITNYINNYWSTKPNPAILDEVAYRQTYEEKNRRSLAQTVHNELIKDERFVLVGRGIYGLKEWGLKKGTVKELIIELLKNKQEPLHSKEIIDYVLQNRKVKRMTVLVNLADKNIFEKLSKGRYTLKAENIK